MSSRAGRFKRTVEDASQASSLMGDVGLAVYVGRKTRRQRSRRAEDRNLAIQSRLDTSGRVTSEYGARYQALLARYNSMNSAFARQVKKNKQFQGRYRNVLSRYDPANKIVTNIGKRYASQGEVWKSPEQEKRYFDNKAVIDRMQPRVNQLGRRSQKRTVKETAARQDLLAQQGRVDAAGARQRKALQRQKKLARRFT